MPSLNYIIIGLARIMRVTKILNCETIAYSHSGLLHYII